MTTKPSLRHVRDTYSLRVIDLVFKTREAGTEVSIGTITKAEKGIAISRRKALALLRALSELTGHKYQREDFPDIRIIEEEANQEEEGDNVA